MVFDFIREHQLNIMLALSAICAMMAILLLITRFLPWKRKYILILMELIATFLLVFDRAAYIYRGEVSSIAYVMVRLSNFMVFFLTSAIIVGFNLYLCLFPLCSLRRRAGHVHDTAGVPQPACSLR